jgi:hypothetical protein
VVSIEEDLLGEDPRSYDSPKDSVREDQRWEGVLEGRTREMVGPWAPQRLLPTEVVLREARCYTEVQEALEAGKTERHCRTGIAVVLVEKGPSEQAALVRSLEHIGHRRPQGRTA